VILSDRIPEPLRPILLKALDENPDERYQTVEEFRRALTGVDSSVAEFVVLDDPGEVVVKEVDVPSLHVEVQQVQKPQVALPGLPPVPPEILDLEGRLEGLNLAIQGLEDGSHASLRPGQQAVREAERQFEQIEQDLEEHCPELSDAVKQRLTQEVARDPRGSITPLCRLAPEVSTRLLLPYLQRLRNREHARRALESARQQFERMRSQQLRDLEHQRVAVADELMRRQEQALDATLEGFFQRVGATGEFPLQAWIEFEPRLEARRLPWTGHELLHRAEKRFLHWQRQPAGEAPVPVELVGEQPDYVTPETGDSTARQSRQTQPLPPLSDLARQVPGDENTWAMVCHLSPLFGCVIPFGNIVGPLVVWLMKRDEFPLVNDQGREALNFQISLLIYALLCLPLVLIVIGVFLLIGVGVFGLVQMILAAIKARAGIRYRYPYCIRFLD